MELTKRITWVNPRFTSYFKQKPFRNKFVLTNGICMFTFDSMNDAVEAGWKIS